MAHTWQRGGRFDKIRPRSSRVAEQYKESGGLGGREFFPTQRRSYNARNSLYSPSSLHEQTRLIAMAHLSDDIRLYNLNDNIDLYNFYPTTSTAGDFDIGQSLRLTSAAEEVGVQPIDTSLEAILRMLPGPMVGLPAGGHHGYDYGEHHGHPLVGWCLTRCLQIRWFRSPPP